MKIKEAPNGLIYVFHYNQIFLKKKLPDYTFHDGGVHINPTYFYDVNTSEEMLVDENLECYALKANIEIPREWFADIKLVQKSW